MLFTVLLPLGTAPEALMLTVKFVTETVVQVTTRQDTLTELISLSLDILTDLFFLISRGFFCLWFPLRKRQMGTQKGLSSYLYTLLRLSADTFDLWSTWSVNMRGHVKETLGSILCRGWRQSQKWDPVTDAIKYLKLLIVQLESVPVLLGYSPSKEALWTRAVNFLLPHLASSHPETKPCVHSITLRKSTIQKQTEASFFFIS